MKLKSFDHKMVYTDDVFQYIDVHLVFDRRELTMRGVTKLDHIKPNGMIFSTPAAVFGALYELVVNQTDIDMDIEEPAMFNLRATLKADANTFVFDFHVLRDHHREG